MSAEEAQRMETEELQRRIAAIEAQLGGGGGYARGLADDGDDEVGGGDSYGGAAAAAMRNAIF